MFYSYNILNTHIIARSLFMSQKQQTFFFFFPVKRSFIKIKIWGKKKKKKGMRCMTQKNKNILSNQSRNKQTYKKALIEGLRDGSTTKTIHISPYSYIYV